MASAYGWTTEEIGRLTERQVEGYLRQIHNEEIDAKDWELSIHGGKWSTRPLKLRDRNAKVTSSGEAYEGQKEHGEKVMDFLKSDKAAGIFKVLKKNG